MERLGFRKCLKSLIAALAHATAISLALVAAWQVASPGEALAAPPAGYNLVYSEEFSGGSISDTSFRPTWSDYSGVNSKSNAITLDSGTMKLNVYTDDNDNHWGGCVSTGNTYSYTFGYCEARVKFCNDTGVCMAYWTEGDAMFEDPPGTAEHGIEIDIVEQRARDENNGDCSDMFHIQLHAEGYGEDHYSHGPNNQPTVNNLEDTWHVIGLDWDADGYSFYCDGNLQWSYYPTWWNDLWNGEFKCRYPEWLIFSAVPGTGTGWEGPLMADYGTVGTTSTFMEVDYCRVYQEDPMFWEEGSGGSGTWSSANTNWSYSDGGSSIAYDNDNEVYFRGTGGTVTISGFTPTTRGLHFEADGYTITGGTLNLSRSDVIVNDGLTATIASAVSGTDGLTLLGEGTLVLSGNNTYSGKTEIKPASVLNIRHANALGSTSEGTVVNAYSALEIQGGITTAAEPLSLRGPGINYNGALRSISGNNTYAGLITLASDTFIKTEADSLTISNAGTITGDGYKLSIYGNGNTTINSVIGTGSGGLFKHGSGTLTLTRANTYTGETEIQWGTLAYGTNNVLASGALTVGEEGWASGTIAMGSYSDTVGAVTLVRGSITGTGTLTSTNGFYVENGTMDVHLAGSVGLTKTDSATVTLAKTNYYTGTTTVSEGTLAYGVNNAIASGAVTVNGGTLNIGSYSDTVGAVTLASGTITGTTGTLTGSSYSLQSGTLSAVIGGGGTVTKSTDGTVIMTKANSYYSATNINDGALRIQNASALGSTVSSTTINSGAALQLSGGITVGEPLNLYGYGESNDGALRSISGNNNLYGSVTLQSSSRINSDSGTLTLSGTISGSGRNLTVGGSGNTILGGVIGTGSGTLTKDGSGTLTLSGANTYTGATYVTAGTLALSGSGTLGANSSVRITNNATLDLGGATRLTGYVGSTGTGNGIVGNIINGTLNIQGYGLYIKEGTVTANLTSTPGSNGRIYIGGDSNATVYLGGVNTVEFWAPSSTIIGYNGVTGAAGNVVLMSNTALGTSSLETQLFTGTLDLNGQTGVTVGDIKLKSGTSSRLINDNTSTAASYSGTLDLGGNTPYIGGDGDMTLSGVLYNGGFIKTGSGTLTLSGNNTYTGLTNVTGGTLELDGVSAENRITSYGGCDIEQGMIVFVDTTLSVTIESLIEASYNDGDWDIGKFLSSTADEDHGLGWIYDGNDLTVAYTVYGDVNLDGTVDSTDTTIISGNLDTYGDWADGDVNYDGYIDATDLAIANGNLYMTQVFSVGIDPVPEPSTILLLISGLLGLLVYAWRKR